MASYWIVVPRGNEELFDLLSLAFQGHSGVSVIADRRAPDGYAHDVEQRAASVELGADEILVAERAQRNEPQRASVEASRLPVRVPARRRTARRSAAPDPHRFVTL